MTAAAMRSPAASSPRMRRPNSKDAPWFPHHAAKPRAKAKRGGAVIEEDDSGDVEDLFDMDDSDSEVEPEEEGEQTRTRAAAPAPWGALPALMLLPSVVVLFIVTLMGYELVRTMQGYKQPSPLTRTLVDTFAPDSLPKE